MLNYFERINSYKQNSYFQINEKYLDLYYKKLPEWIQNLDIVKDILSFASSIGLKDEYDILYVRIFGGEYDEKMKESIENIFHMANLILAEELGPSEFWKTLKTVATTNDRHFAAIPIVDFKIKPIANPPKEPDEEIKIEKEEVNNDRKSRRSSKYSNSRDA